MFKDILDITIVALLIYQIVLVIHRTRAVQMLFGVAGLAALFFISFSYNLNALNWLLEHFFDSFFLIVIIVFQDQIRTGLARFGSGKNVLKRFGKITPLEEEFDEIVEAAFALGRKRIGALIVFERVNGLKNYLLTGTELNAVIHSDLIYSIFQIASPLHDGAIIVSRREIRAAGCFLPLSNAKELDKHLGTRHRAALGISEVTDAISVVVSEETGRINIAFSGTLYPVDDMKSLRIHLKKFMAGKSGRPNGLKSQTVKVSGK